MLKRLSQSLYERSISSAYTQRFKRKGASAEGVFGRQKSHRLPDLSMPLSGWAPFLAIIAISWQILAVAMGHYMHLCVPRPVIILLIISGLISMPA